MVVGLLSIQKAFLTCIHHDDLETADVEMLWLEVKNNRQKPFLLCYCYRPPSSTSDWIVKIKTAIEKANIEQKEIIMLGDFDINLLNETSTKRQWIDTTNNLNLKQLVQTPTRVTDTTATLIDHVFTNYCENIINVTVPVYAISDHYPVCLTRKITKTVTKVLYINLSHTETQNLLVSQLLFPTLKINLGQYLVSLIQFSTNMLPKRKKE